MLKIFQEVEVLFRQKSEAKSSSAFLLDLKMHSYNTKPYKQCVILVLKGWGNLLVSVLSLRMVPKAFFSLVLL